MTIRRLTVEEAKGFAVDRNLERRAQMLLGLPLKEINGELKMKFDTKFDRDTAEIQMLRIGFVKINADLYEHHQYDMRAQFSRTMGGIGQMLTVTRLSERPRTP